jgi:hypothetical protein
MTVVGKNELSTKFRFRIFGEDQAGMRRCMIWRVFGRAADRRSSHCGD